MTKPALSPAERCVCGHTAEISALRAAFKKAEEERDAQTRRADVTLAKMCDARDAVVARATAAEARVADANEECVVLRGIVEKNDATIEKLEKALRELHGRLGLCHGAIMGYGCSGNAHSPKCATVAAAPKEKP